MTDIRDQAGTLLRHADSHFVPAEVHQDDNRRATGSCWQCAHSLAFSFAAQGGKVACAELRVTALGEPWARCWTITIFIPHVPYGPTYRGRARRARADHFVRQIAVLTAGDPFKKAPEKIAAS